MPNSPRRTRFAANAGGTASFAAPWHETSDAAEFLDPGALPIPKVQKAWERTAKEPFKKGNGARTVWRRVEKKSLGSEKNENEMVRVVKKQCLDGGETGLAREEIDEREVKRKGAVPTVMEKKGASPRKRRVPNRRRSSILPKETPKLDLQEQTLPPPERFDRPKSPVARILDAEEENDDGEDGERIVESSPTRPRRISQIGGSETELTVEDEGQQDEDVPAEHGPALLDTIQESEAEDDEEGAAFTEDYPGSEMVEFEPEEEGQVGLSIIYEDVDAEEESGSDQITENVPQAEVDSEQLDESMQSPEKSINSAEDTYTESEATEQSSLGLSLLGADQSILADGIEIRNADMPESAAMNPPVTSAREVDTPDEPITEDEIPVDTTAQIDQSAVLGADSDEKNAHVHLVTAGSTVDVASPLKQIDANVSLSLAGVTGINGGSDEDLNQPEDYPATTDPKKQLSDEALKADRIAGAASEDFSAKEPLTEIVPDEPAGLSTVENLSLPNPSTNATEPEPATKANMLDSEEDPLAAGQGLASASESGVATTTEETSPSSNRPANLPVVILSKSPTPQKSTLDIADGLTLSLSPKKMSIPTRTSPRKAASHSVAKTESFPDEITAEVDADTAILKDFLSRAAASKANRCATVHKRESVSNRRDSDAIREALASPRKVLEDKDPNSPSPKKKRGPAKDAPELSAKDLLAQEPEEDVDDETATIRLDEPTTPSTRRSTRTRSSRIPPPSALPTPSRISIRTHAQEPVVSKKTEAQELALLTRNNTRRNKGTSVPALTRLKKLETETALDSPYRSSEDDTTAELPGRRLRWDPQLVYFQDAEGKSVQLTTALPIPTLLAAESEVEETEATLPASTPDSKKRKAKDSGETSTPKARRIRGLGAANGTPAKGLLAPVASLLPDLTPDDENDAAVSSKDTTAQPSKPTKSKRTPKAKSTAPTNTPVLPTAVAAVDTIPALAEAAKSEEAEPKPKPKERRSRLTAPKKVVLPGSSVAATSKVSSSEEKTSAMEATPARRRRRVA